MKSQAPRSTTWFGRWKWWIAGVIAVILGITVVAPFVFIHFIEGTPPPPLSLTTSATTSPTAKSPAGATASSGTAGAATFAGVYKISSGSQAQYRVSETLFGQSTTAVGSTSTINGSMTVLGTSITAANFSVPLSTVHSDQQQRDDQFDNRIMDVADFPNATFTLTQPATLGSVPATGTIVNESVTGNLTMHGVTKSVTFTMQFEYTGSGIKVSGSIPITFADWNIQNPSGGPAQVGDSGTLGFLLVLAD